MAVIDSIPCPDCKGKGWRVGTLLDFDCPRCKGSGVIPAEPNLCDNCGKLGREHSPMAECWPASSEVEGDPPSEPTVR